jgi:hypothetical protein
MMTNLLLKLGFAILYMYSQYEASNCVAFLLSVADGMYIQEIIAALPSDLKVVDLSAVSKRIPNPL